MSRLQKKARRAGKQARLARWIGETRSAMARAQLRDGASESVVAIRLENVKHFARLAFSFALDIYGREKGVA